MLPEMAEQTARVPIALRMQSVPTPGLALVSLVLLNLMWGGSLPATKAALESFGPFTLAAARLLLAGVLFVLVLTPARLREVGRANALRIAGLGMIGFAGVQIFQALGAAQTSAASATVLASTGPLWIALLAPPLLRERPRALAVVGLLLAMVGVVAITGVQDGSALGIAIVLLSSFSYALYTVLGKDLMQRFSPLVLCTVSCLGGAAATLPLAAWEISSGAPLPSLQGWLLLAYLAVLVTFIGFAIWFWGLRALPAARAGALIFLQPLSGLALSVVLLGDRPTPTFSVGCVLVLLGVYLAAGRG